VHTGEEMGSMEIKGEGRKVGEEGGCKYFGITTEVHNPTS
jgi:hypothetical protein